MALGIKKDILSAEILQSVSDKTFLFLDTSLYKEPPTRPLLEVTLPGHSKYTLVNIVPGKINVLNSHLLGLSTLSGTSDVVSLPDGVWSLKYKICPYDLIYVQLYHLRTTSLECSLRSIFEAMDFGNWCGHDEKLKSDLVDIMLLMEAGKAEAISGQVKRAQDRYQKAQKRIEKLLCNLRKD